MKLILTEDDGTLLDAVDVTRGDWYLAKENAQIAQSILLELKPGDVL